MKRTNKKYIKNKTVRKQRIFEHQISVKDMPPYDPDAEVTSLAYTIPFWIGLIDRVLTNNIENSSISARQNLKRILHELKFNIETLILHMEEINDKL